jgi:hypothetical protein
MNVPFSMPDESGLDVYQQIRRIDARIRVLRSVAGTDRFGFHFWARFLP